VSLGELLADYRAKHADPRNLAVHALTVPIGALGLLAAPLALAGLAAGALSPARAALAAAAGAAAFLAAVAAQGVAHKRERLQSTFSGPHDLAWRLVREQLVLGPLFLAGRLRDRRE
jgi:uncharacterized membrane protein YGL010W